MRVQGIITTVAASLVLSACYTSRVITTPNLTATAPRQIRVTRVDGTEATVYTPRLDGQTIMGRSNGRECLLESCRKPDISVQLSDVKEIRVKTIDKPKTYALAAVGVAAIFGATIGLKGKGPDMGCMINCMTVRTGPEIPTSTLVSAISRLAHGLSAAVSR